TSPVRATCSWRSQFAVLTACQTPFKSALPSAVRGALYASAALAAGVASRWSAVARTAAALANSAPLTHFFCIKRLLSKTAGPAYCPQVQLRYPRGVMGMSPPPTFWALRAYYLHFNIRGAAGTTQSDSNRNKKTALIGVSIGYRNTL